MPRLTGILAAAALAACGGAPTPTLEVGVRDGRAFRRCADGEPLPLVFFPNGFWMIKPSVRLPGVDLVHPDPELVVTVDGFDVGGDLDVFRIEVEEAPDGSRLLWEVPVSFNWHGCCVACRDAHIEASLVDAEGTTWTGGANVRIGTEPCDAPSACCEDPEACSGDPRFLRSCE